MIFDNQEIIKNAVIHVRNLTPREEHEDCVPQSMSSPSKYYLSDFERLTYYLITRASISSQLDKNKCEGAMAVKNNNHWLPSFYLKQVRKKNFHTVVTVS